MSQLLHYKILATTTLDFLKEHFSKSIIVDGRSTIGEYYEQQQLLVEKYYQKKATSLLKKKFESLSAPLLRRGDLEFARYISEKTGKDLDIVSDEKEEMHQHKIAELLKEHDKEKKPSSRKSKRYKEIPAIFAPDGRKHLHIVHWTSGQQSSTSVTIVFEKASTGIYCKIGLDQELTAVWKDNDSILITTKKDHLREAVKYRQVQSFDDIVTIEYAEV